MVDTFVNMTSMVVAEPHGGAQAFERALVADLRRTAAYAGDDLGVASLIATVREQSRRFAELWDEGSAGVHQSLVQTVHHPVVGEVTIDCDLLTVPDSDLRIIVCTAAAGSHAIEKLARLRASGPGSGPACAAARPDVTGLTWRSPSRTDASGAVANSG